MKRLELFRKKLLPLLVCVAVAVGQVPVMAADTGSFSDSIEGSAEQKDTQDIQEQSGTDTKTGADLEESGMDNESAANGEQPGIEQKAAEDITPEDTGEDKESSEASEEAFSDSTEDTFGDGEGGSEEDSSDIQYIKGRPLTEEEEEEQLAPFDTLNSYSTAVEIGNDVNEIPMGRAAAYPSYYNAAGDGYVTSVKNQDPYGMCWAFAMASMLETSLLTQGLGTYDLSEEHLAYFLANRRNDPLGNTEGDVNHHFGTDDSGNVDYHEGGNDLIASMFLSTWSGMTTEADVPLATDATHTQKTGAIPSASKAYDAVAYLKNAYFSDYSINAMKKLLVANKSVTVMYNAQNAYYNASTAAYSYPTSTKSVNHVVTVVGWDDNYSARNFKAASGVTGDGAWIVKNSWGQDWGKDGYFYMSYEDKSLSELVSATATTEPKYANNYFYDGTSGLGSVKMYAGEKFAAVFRANAGNGKAEKLGEVTLTGKTAGASYAVQVYTNLKNAKDPTSGTPAYATPVICTQSMAGVMTFTVPEVLISQNSLYSVVVTNAGKDTVEYYVEADLDYGWFKFDASILAGQSFIYYPEDQAWMDAIEFYPSITPRIKAHTRTLENAAGIKLDAASLSLYSGDQKTLKATAAGTEADSSGIGWESSDTSVVTVDGNGAVTAKNPGTATVTCYEKNSRGIQASCKITVKLCQVSGARISSRAFNKIKISWNAVNGCSRYEIFRRENGGKEKKITTVSSGTGTWQDTSVKTGSTYTYRIRAVYVSSGKTTVYGAASAAISAKAELAKAVAAVTAASGPRNTVSWKKISGASGYYIYRRVQGKGWTRIAAVKSTVFRYQDSSVQGITSYAYAVRAYRNVNGKKVLGGYKPSGYVLSYPSLQRISSVKKTSKGLKLCWKVQKKADCYQIYRKTKNSSWKRISTVSGGSRSSFEDKTAKKGITYYYAVRAGVKTSAGKLLCGSYAAKAAKR